MTTTTFPFLFYGSRPRDYFNTGSFAIKFRGPLDSGKRRKIGGAVREAVFGGMPAMAMEGIAALEWKGDVLWIHDETGEGAHSLPADLGKGLPAVHASFAIAEVVNHCARDVSDDQWERWSLAQKAWPDDDMLDPGDRSLYTETNRPG